MKEVLPLLSLLCGGLMDNWWVYIIQKETKLYVGITTDLENRMRQHEHPNSPSIVLLQNLTLELP